MNSNSVHSLARLMGAAIPLVALALIACPEKKEETPPAVVGAGAPAAVPEPTPTPAPAPIPEMDAGAAPAPDADAGATLGTPLPGQKAPAGAGTKAGPTTTGTTTGAKPPPAETGTKAETTETGAAAGGAAKAVTEPDKKTQRTWKAKCASCHGIDGKGATEQGKKMKVRDMTTAAYQSKATDAQIRKAIADGYQGTVDGVAQDMPGYSSELAADQLDALVNYVRWVGKK